MSNKVIARRTFQKQAKRLARRYKSFPNDLQKLVDELKENASLGTPLGGARVITYVYLQAETVYLLSIYDKAETENISDDELKYLVKEVEEDFK